MTLNLIIQFAYGAMMKSMAWFKDDNRPSTKTSQYKLFDYTTGDIFSLFLRYIVKLKKRHGNEVKLFIEC